jgi:hypothetical protein
MEKKGRLAELHHDSNEARVPLSNMRLRISTKGSSSSKSRRCTLDTRAKGCVSLHKSHKTRAKDVGMKQQVVQGRGDILHILYALDRKLLLSNL